MPNAILLDLTRLVSRLDRAVQTGIDRVEAAYLAEFLARNLLMFGLVRSRWGYILLARTGCALLADLLAAPRAPGQAMAQLRAAALARRPHLMLGSLLARLPHGGVYVNVGHSNLSASVLRAMQRAQLRSLVLIHDTIPLDHPNFARAGTHAAFAAKIAATARCADWVVHISADAQRKTEAHFAAFGRVPPAILAPLGVTLAAPTLAYIAPTRPYFIALGTLEPRKNLTMLFDIWAKLPRNAPPLVVVGAKGWADPALFAQMAKLQATGAVIHSENLSDGAVASLLQGAIALLFPSLAEGFGLPPLEAAALGTPVIASDLPVLREVCGDFAVYLNPNDSYSWMETIQLMAAQGQGQHTERKPHAVPLWAHHFKTVLTHLL